MSIVKELLEEKTGFSDKNIAAIALNEALSSKNISNNSLAKSLDMSSGNISDIFKRYYDKDILLIDKYINEVLSDKRKSGDWKNRELVIPSKEKVHKPRSQKQQKSVSK